MSSATLATSLPSGLETTRRIHFAWAVTVVGSGQDVLDRLGPRLDQRDRAGAEVVVLVRVDPQGRVDGGEQLGRVGLAVGHLVPGRVRLAVGARLDPGPGQRARPGRGEVVPAQARVDARRPPEL